MFDSPHSGSQLVHEVRMYEKRLLISFSISFYHLKKVITHETFYLLGIKFPKVSVPPNCV